MEIRTARNSTPHNAVFSLGDRSEADKLHAQKGSIVLFPNVYCSHCVYAVVRFRDVCGHGVISRFILGHVPTPRLQHLNHGSCCGTIFPPVQTTCRSDKTS